MGGPVYAVIAVAFSESDEHVLRTISMNSGATRKRIAAGILAEAIEPRRLMSVLPYTLTDLASFANSGGYQSDAGLVRDTSGNLFGTTRLGGSNNLGTIFKVANGSSSVTTVASFNAGSGSYPIADLTSTAAVASMALRHTVARMPLGPCSNLRPAQRLSLPWHHSPPR